MPRANLRLSAGIKGERLAERVMRSATIAEPVAPPPFSIRWYQPGDEDAWVSIWNAADALRRYNRERFEREFGGDAAVLRQRQCYLCDAAGRAVGTATAWYNDDYHGMRWGQIHWVAIIPQMQGRGLARPMLASAMKRLRDLGHARVYLVTQPYRLPAIRLYLSFGFVPEIGNDQEREIWERVLAQCRAK